MKALISSHSNSLASSSVVVHTHVLNGLIAYSLALMNHLLFQTNVALCRQHAGFQTVSSDPVTEVPTTQDTFTEFLRNQAYYVNVGWRPLGALRIP